MYCQKCSLHYPDHLSFCRRCGQSLVRSTSEMVVESYCCTRCGARVVRGENFCQHCGNRVSITLQETVIGACYHCGTSWRSGWLFCKNCGLDRKRALLLSTSTPAPGSSKFSSLPAEEVTEGNKIRCQSCGNEAKPYSRFCESCGSGLDGSTGSTKASTVIASVQTKTEGQSDLGVNKISDQKRASSQTIFEPPSNTTEKPEAGFTHLSSRENSVPLRDENDIASIQPKALNDQGNAGGVSDLTLTGESTSTDSVEVAATAAKENSEFQGKTVVTPLPPFGGALHRKRPESFREIFDRNRSSILQVAALILLVTLLLAVVFWWVNREPDISLQSSPSTNESTATPAEANANQKVQSLNNTPLTNSPAAPEGMVYVPGGKFEMGRNGFDEYERPAHFVTVKPFFMDRTEITNEQYSRFVSATGHRAPTHWQDGKFSAAETNLPVVNVSWDDAVAFAKWANKRLPTEAEWEFAARGTDGRIYPWGNSWNPAMANAGKETGGNVLEVGRFPRGASPFGVLDMCGNVWEWTSSSLLDYADQSKELAPGRVIRGGAFDAPSARATATYRGILPTDRMRDKTGFRTIRDIQ